MRLKEKVAIITGWAHGICTGKAKEETLQRLGDIRCFRVKDLAEEVLGVCTMFCDQMRAIFNNHSKRGERR